MLHCKRPDPTQSGPTRYAYKGCQEFLHFLRGYSRYKCPESTHSGPKQIAYIGRQNILHFWRGIYRREWPESTTLRRHLPIHS